jgi:hypothetical protein
MVKTFSVTNGSYFCSEEEYAIRFVLGGATTLHAGNRWPILAFPAILYACMSWLIPMKK